MKKIDKEAIFGLYELFGESITWLGDNKRRMNKGATQMDKRIGWYIALEDGVTACIAKYGKNIRVLWLSKQFNLFLVQDNNHKVLGYFSVIMPDVATIETSIVDTHLVEAQSAGAKFYHDLEAGKQAMYDLYGKDIIITYDDAKYNKYIVWEPKDELQASMIKIDEFYVFKIEHPALKDSKGRTKEEYYAQKLEQELAQKISKRQLQLTDDVVEKLKEVSLTGADGVIRKGFCTESWIHHCHPEIEQLHIKWKKVDKPTDGKNNSCSEKLPKNPWYNGRKEYYAEMIYGNHDKSSRHVCFSEYNKDDNKFTLNFQKDSCEGWSKERILSSFKMFITQIYEVIDLEKWDKQIKVTVELEKKEYG